MFEGCSSLHNLDGLKDWKLSYSCDNLNFPNMFEDLKIGNLVIHQIVHVCLKDVFL